MSIKFNTKDVGLVIVLALIVLSAVAFYTLSASRIVVATANDTQASPAQKDLVSIMYAASLIKTYEESLGPKKLQVDTEYHYQGEARGSVQIANMTLDGLRKPDVFVSADTSPVIKLMNATYPLADWLVKFGTAELARGSLLEFGHY